MNEKKQLIFVAALWIIALATVAFVYSYINTALGEETTTYSGSGSYRQETHNPQLTVDVAELQGSN